MSINNEISTKLKVLAKSVCNITSLNNAYSSIMLEDKAHTKITYNKALEFISNCLGFNTYKGLLTQFENSPIDIKTTDHSIEKAFIKSFGIIDANETRKNLYNLFKLYFSFFSTNLIFNHPSNVVLYTLSTMEFSRWNGVVKAYLDENLATPKTYSQKTVFSHLLTANMLGAVTNGVDIQEVDYFEPNDIAIEGDKRSAMLVDFMVGECFNTLNYNQVAIKRNVLFYIAKHKQDPRTNPSYFKNKNPNTHTAKDAELNVLSKKITKLLSQNQGIKIQMADKELEQGWVDTILFNDKKFNELFKGFTSLTNCTIDQDWTCMALRPTNIPTRAWNDVVDYYNAIMDHFKFYFMEVVENARFDLSKVYINTSGLVMYKTDESFNYTLFGQSGTVSANDFCTVANVVLSNKIHNEYPKSLFVKYMVFYTYYMHRETLVNGKGIDNFLNVVKFAD
jgi:hypothetical protein